MIDTFDRKRKRCLKSNAVARCHCEVGLRRHICRPVAELEKDLDKTSESHRRKRDSTLTRRGP